MQPSVSEPERLSAIGALDILNTLPEPHLDAICRTARDLFDVSAVLITVVGQAEVWVKARNGSFPNRVPRATAFCDRAIQGSPDTAFVIVDTADDRTIASELVIGAAERPRFYAGVPLALRPGLHVGTLCLLDNKPRPDFGEQRSAQLVNLARVVEAMLFLSEARVAIVNEASKRQHLDLLLSERESRVQSALEFQHIV